MRAGTRAAINGRAVDVRTGETLESGSRGTFGQPRRSNGTRRSFQSPRLSRTRILAMKSKAVPTGITFRPKAGAPLRSLSRATTVVRTSLLSQVLGNFFHYASLKKVLNVIRFSVPLRLRPNTLLFL
jgi:hypothetical protein